MEPWEDERVPLRVPPAAVWVVVVVAAAIIGFTLRAVVSDPDPEPPGTALGGSIKAFLSVPAPRTTAAYRGLGAWVDVYDAIPAYTNGRPPLTPSSVADMAEAGVSTLYFQAARLDDKADAGVIDPAVTGQWLVEAHRHHLKVVAWYLPKLTETDVDLQKLEAIRMFNVLGHQFDGVAVDIESVEVTDPIDRGDRLVTLSSRLKDISAGEPLGAIVLPPVQLEVVNPQYWPSFPWREIAGDYDVWMPMGYWTLRRADSGYHDGYRYVEESTRRLRANLDDPDALVHPIGGIADEVTDDELRRFNDAAKEIGAIGASVYDWQTLSPRQRKMIAVPS